MPDDHDIHVYHLDVHDHDDGSCDVYVHLNDRCATDYCRGDNDDHVYVLAVDDLHALLDVARSFDYSDSPTDYDAIFAEYAALVAAHPRPDPSGELPAPTGAV